MVRFGLFNATFLCLSTLFATGLQHADLTVCPCAPAALQLLWMGYFPSAPLGPTLAVSLQLLSLVRQLFMWMPPNTTAWCESFEAYLAGMGYKVDTKV
ncbi:hypothetical protein EDC04DRAFT_2570768 [Pisolithus marmoratus]|nr:hypothetical protein EDC04DRAFT_2570768 [Pisolithus marmoratus]